MHTGSRRKRKRDKGLTAKGWKRGRPSVWFGGTSRRGTITADQFVWERQSAGLSREGAADLLGVGLRTIGYWETGRVSPSYAAFKLLRVFRQGEFIDPAWSGYRLVRGVLVTPEGRELRPTDMGWMGLLLGRARLAREIAKERDALRVQLAMAGASRHVESACSGFSGSVSGVFAPISIRWSAGCFTEVGNHFSPVVPVESGVLGSVGPVSNTGQKVAPGAGGAV